jgi:hypothetical protein
MYNFDWRFACRLSVNVVMHGSAHVTRKVTGIEALEHSCTMTSTDGS